MKPEKLSTEKWNENVFTNLLATKAYCAGILLSSKRDIWMHQHVDMLNALVLTLPKKGMSSEILATHASCLYTADWSYQGSVCILHSCRNKQHRWGFSDAYQQAVPTLHKIVGLVQQIQNSKYCSQGHWVDLWFHLRKLGSMNQWMDHPHQYAGLVFHFSRNNVNANTS